MRLLKLIVEGVPLFKDDRLDIDLFAQDRVPRQDDGMLVADVTRVGRAKSVFSQNIVGISGVNATGKTTTLRLIRLVLDLLAGEVLTREFRGENLLLGKVGKKLDVKAVFWHADAFYLIESRLSFPDDSTLFLPGRLFYEDETIWMLAVGRVNRRMISDIQTFKRNAVIIRRRNGTADDPLALSEEQLMLLGDSRSIVSVITGRVRTNATSIHRELLAQTMPAPVVQAFDPSVEILDWNQENEVYTLKFRGEPARVVDRNVAGILLSRGTIYGTELVNKAVDVLGTGSYLLIDEIEEAINRSLVATVIDLFASPVTNPNGAQLIFTTHYPELLDVPHRKDNVYLLVRDLDNRTEVIKYSDRVSRIENKKSEVVMSDLIKGSMPRYPDVRAMRNYVRGRVNGQD
ncbi:MAG: ATP-binding protein [Atopobiaceae bacterium]|nr:ATP-binding protein [Atopobiaceae bacterium]